MLYDIENLMLRKDFAALSPAERAQVLAEMSQEEYEQLRHVMLAARQLEADAMPPAHLGAALKARMAAHAKPTVWRRLMSAKVPAWQAAAVFLMGIAAVSFMKKTEVVEKAVTAWQTRVDTVYRTANVPGGHTANVPVGGKKRGSPSDTNSPAISKPTQLTTSMATAPEKQDTQSFNFELPTRDMNNAHVGTSLGDAPELMVFFTQ
jgi:hypothetical protein